MESQSTKIANLWRSLLTKNIHLYLLIKQDEFWLNLLHVAYATAAVSDSNAEGDAVISRQAATELVQRQLLFWIVNFDEVTKVLVIHENGPHWQELFREIEDAWCCFHVLHRAG